MQGKGACTLLAPGRHQLYLANVEISKTSEKLLEKRANFSRENRQNSQEATTTQLDARRKSWARVDQPASRAGLLNLDQSRYLVRTRF